MSLGMMMVPPTLIALPLKLGVFLLAGGWNLVISSLVRSFGWTATWAGRWCARASRCWPAWAGPVLGALLVVGLVVGVIQAATQINDPAVSFVPRMAGGLLVVLLAGNWIMERLAKYLVLAFGESPGASSATCPRCRRR